ncbi:MAG: hypothetical protein ACREP7_21425 [Lysobacter sp.]
MLNLTQEDAGRPLGELETTSAYEAQTHTEQRPLSQLERGLLAAKSGGYWRVLIALALSASIAGLLVLPLGGAGAAFVAACVVFMLSLNFPISENRGRYVRDDLQLGTKVAISGRVVAARTVRSHCVFTLASTPAGAHTLEFKLPRAAYAALRQEQSVDLWYVPSSGIVMELTAGSYRYRLGDDEKSLRA